MKLTIYLIYVVLLVVCTQTTDAKNAHRQRKTPEKILCDDNALTIQQRDLRGIKDLWAKIKESAIISWNYIKLVAENTMEKINIYITDLKAQATELKRKFEEKLEELKNKFMDIINNFYGTAEFVKQCAEKEKENIQNILKEIMAQMTDCISKEINQLTSFSRNISLPAMNEADFVTELNEKASLCGREVENVHECINKVREDIFDNFMDLENDIIQNHYEARNIADNVKETITTCSLNNFINATNLISAEIVEITKCVVEAKGNEAETSINETNEIS